MWEGALKMQVGLLQLPSLLLTRRTRYISSSPTPIPDLLSNAFNSANIRDQCPLLRELEFTIARDQGSITEVAVYKTFATFPVLRRLILGFAFMNHTLDAERRAHYDEFDRRRFSEGMVDRPRYGDVRRALVDRAIDERFARTVYRLASRASRRCHLEQLELKIDSGASNYPYRLRDSSETSLSGVLKYICRSWTVEPGVRDDRPDEVVT